MNEMITEKPEIETETNDGDQVRMRQMVVDGSAADNDGGWRRWWSKPGMIGPRGQNNDDGARPMIWIARWWERSNRRIV